MLQCSIQIEPYPYAETTSSHGFRLLSSTRALSIRDSGATCAIRKDSPSSLQSTSGHQSTTTSSGKCDHPSSARIRALRDFWPVRDCFLVCPSSLHIRFDRPGTGKTITIVEAIQQVLKSSPNAKILACAPSNSAADLIASRLMALSTAELFRFYAPSRFKSQVPDALLSYAYIRDDGHFSVPPLAIMKHFRVVVTTCVSASVISGIGLPRGLYSHIFIDEAGQATEPEAFVSIKTIADNSTNIILSGDPKQLGPIIRSGIARELGLEKSYIERLMATEAYDIQTGHGLSCVFTSAYETKYLTRLIGS